MRNPYHLIHSLTYQVNQFHSYARLESLTIYKWSSCAFLVHFPNVTSVDEEVRGKRLISTSCHLFLSPAHSIASTL